MKTLKDLIEERKRSVPDFLHLITYKPPEIIMKGFIENCMKEACKQMAKEIQGYDIKCKGKTAAEVAHFTAGLEARDDALRYKIKQFFNEQNNTVD